MYGMRVWAGNMYSDKHANKIEEKSQKQDQQFENLYMFELMESSIVPLGIQITYKWNTNNIHKKEKRKEKKMK